MIASLDFIPLLLSPMRVRVPIWSVPILLLISIGIALYANRRDGER